MKKYALEFTVQILIVTILLVAITLIAIKLNDGNITGKCLLGVSIWSYFVSSVFHLLVFEHNDYPPLIKFKKEEASK